MPYRATKRPSEEPDPEPPPARTPIDPTGGTGHADLREVLHPDHDWATCDACHQAHAEPLAHCRLCAPDVVS
jgi:hypothetical protein